MITGHEALRYIGAIQMPLGEVPIARWGDTRLALVDYGVSLRKVASMPAWHDVKQSGAIVWRVTINSLDLISFPAVNREAMRHYARTWL